MKDLVLAVLLLAAAPLAAENVNLDGYAEWRRDGCLIVDGQRVKPAPGMAFKGHDGVKDFASIPLGYEVRAKGTRAADGAVLATELDARKNGSALFESDLVSSFDQTEQQFLRAGRVFEEDDHGKQETIGRLRTSGRDVERVRRIMADLVPPYTSASDFRVYVVDNEEWNAMAAPNRSIYVYSGLLRDMDDDELAIVLGHELVHATHEHSRKGFKKQLLVMLGAAVVDEAAKEATRDRGKRTALQIGTFLLASAINSGYGREHEDQADRTGLRYAYEAGYDVRKAPGLWRRFSDKYGDGNRVVNFFFSDHAQSRARAAKLARELELNYEGGAGEE